MGEVKGSWRSLLPGHGGVSPWEAVPLARGSSLASLLCMLSSRISMTLVCVSLNGNSGVVPTSRWEKQDPLGSPWDLVSCTRVTWGMSGKERPAAFFSPRELNEWEHWILVCLCLLPSTHPYGYVCTAHKLSLDDKEVTEGTYRAVPSALPWPPE